MIETVSVYQFAIVTFFLIYTRYSVNIFWCVYSLGQAHFDVVFKNVLNDFVMLDFFKTCSVLILGCDLIKKWKKNGE